MKISKHKIGSVSTSYHRIDVEDGPFIEAGPQYVTGLQFKVELIRRKRIGDEEWGDVTVSGRRLNMDGRLGVAEHKRVFAVWKGLPDWLKEILDESEKNLKVEEYLRLSAEADDVAVAAGQEIEQ